MRSPQAASRRGGNVAIEFGIVLPLLLLLSFGIIDLGRLLWINIALTRGTQAAARCGALNASACPDIGAYAASQTWGPSDITASAFAATTATCGFQVSGTYNFQFTIPWFPQFGPSPPGTTTLTATACYPAQTG